MIRFVLILLSGVFLLAGCSEEPGEDQLINSALNYLQHRPVTIELEADEAWEVTKKYLELPYSDYTKTSYIQINEDRTITFFNITDDCKYEAENGIQAIQSASGVFSDLTFSDIRFLKPSETKINDVTFYRLDFLMNEDIQVFTDWFTCEELPIEELTPAQVVLMGLVFTFPNKSERDTYQKYAQILIDIDY